MNETEPVVGRCWRCGYSLRGLDSRRCPECGREFDPADRRSTNPGPDVGRIAQQLIKYPNWPTFIVALIAFALVAWGTGWPHNWWPNFSDWPLLWAWVRRRPPASGLTNRWIAFAAGATLTAAIFLWIIARLMLRALVLFWRPVPGDERPRRPRPLALAELLLMLSLLLVGTGGNQRIGREWSNEIIAHPPSPRHGSFLAGNFFISTPFPAWLSATEIDDVLAQLIQYGDDPVHRRAGLKILIEQIANYSRERFVYLSHTPVPVADDATQREKNFDFQFPKENDRRGRVVLKVVGDPDWQPPYMHLGRSSMILAVVNGKTFGQSAPPDPGRFRPYITSSRAMAEAELQKRLLAEGLTESQADDLLDSWRDETVSHPGTDLFVLLTPEEYAAVFQPAPRLMQRDANETVRAGVVMIRLSDLGRN